MSFFERLKTAASAEWRAYTEHPFTEGLADGSLPEAAFRHYLVQDYLFLIEFARAYALSVYKSPTPRRHARSGCRPLGHSRRRDEPARKTLRRLGPVGRPISNKPLRRSRCWPIPATCSTRECAAICWRSRWRSPLASSATPRSRRGSPRGPMRSLQQTPIASGSPSMPGRPIRKSRRRRGASGGLADRYATPAREAELIAIFKEATRLEADFWEMGWRVGKR